METGVSKPTTSHILHSQHPPSFSWLSPLSPFFYCKVMAFLHNFPLFFLLIHRESVCGGEWNSLAYVAGFSLNTQHKINVALVQFLHNNSGVENCYAGWKQSHLLHYYNHILNWIRTQYFLASYSIVACIKDINNIMCERILLTTINRFTINKKKDTASSLALAMTRFSDILLIKLRFC